MKKRLAAPIVFLFLAGSACTTNFQTDDVEEEDGIDEIEDGTLDQEAPDAADLDLREDGDPPPDVEPDGDVTDGEEVEIPPTCGNGEVDDGEECDDGRNGNDEDGCTDACTFTCHDDGECQNDNLCDGTESCNPDAHTCQTGEPLEEGFVCDEGPPRRICLEEACTQSACGDGFVDTGGGEQCEPPSVGTCTDDCTYSCTGDGDCTDDGNVCNGEEFCDMSAHECASRNAPPQFSPCGDSPPSICLSQTCQESICGDNYTDSRTGEECDDGLTGGDDDGCTTACRFSCHSPDDCQDNHICNGMERCMDGGTGQLCQPPAAPASSDTPCDDLNPCTVTDLCNGTGTCVGTGNPCDDGVPCTENLCNEGTGVCSYPIISGRCLISGTCYNNNDPNPANVCIYCNSAAPTVWSYRPSTYSCDDDNPCTATDLCNGSGTCTGTVNPCDDGHDCTSNLCDPTTGNCSYPIVFGNCLIDGVCYSDGNPNPANECQYCSSMYPSAWRNRPTGYSCEDGNYCTVDDVCASGTCVGTAVTNLHGVVKVAAGGTHTCALLENGGVKCWGSGSQGQLGRGSTLSSNVPVDVIALPTAAVDIAAGRQHNCVILDDGDVMCWGDNTYGQIGDGSTTDRWSPVAVSLPYDAVEISALYHHTCVVLSTSTTMCWGYNNLGQLGDNSSGTNRLTPVYVTNTAGTPYSSMSHISAGGEHSCSLIDSGPYCWGSNAYGQLGINAASPTQSPVPLQVVGYTASSGVTWVEAGGSHSCALIGSSGELRCWGRNNYGQVGDADYPSDKYSPALVWNSGGRGVELGGNTSFEFSPTSLGATDFNGWGFNNNGQCGTGTVTPNYYETPQYVRLSVAINQMSASHYNHTCARDIFGGAWCWGMNFNGQCGSGNTDTPQLTPTLVVCN